VRNVLRGEPVLAGLRVAEVVALLLADDGRVVAAAVLSGHDDLRAGSETDGRLRGVVRGWRTVGGLGLPGVPTVLLGGTVGRLGLRRKRGGWLGAIPGVLLLLAGVVLLVLLLMAAVLLRVPTLSELRGRRAAAA
jgi:hypothetical protein